VVTPPAPLLGDHPHRLAVDEGADVLDDVREVASSPDEIRD